MNQMNDLFQQYGKRSLLGVLLLGLIYVVIWAALVAFIPNGWWITVINVVFLIFSFVFIGIGSMQALKLFMKKPLAFFIASVILFVWVVLIRSFILSLFGVI